MARSTRRAGRVDHELVALLPEPRLDLGNAPVATHVATLTTTGIPTRLGRQDLGASRADAMIVSVRRTDELVELPFAFALRDRELLLPDKFREAMRARGVSVVEQQLEALHRAR